MRGINKLDGDIYIPDTEKGSLDSEEQDSSISALTRLPTFFTAGNSLGIPLSNDSVSLKKAYGFCFQNYFQPILVKTSSDSLTVYFAVCHSIHHQLLLSQLKRHIPGIHSSIDSTEFPVNSYFQLKFTTHDSRIFLHMECYAFVDLFDYNFKHLLDLLADFDCREEYSDGLNGSNMGITEQTVVPDTMHSAVKVRQLTTDRRFFVKPLLASIRDYVMNCLSRFEELSLNREMEAYGVALHLGLILKRIEENYLTVPFDDYTKALTLLGTLECNETYQMDPQIWLSMPKIRDALELLKTKALIGDRGIEFDVNKLGLLMQELILHEGARPKPDIWFPLGTVDHLSQQLEDFYPNYKQILKPAVI
ncbi:hypothetical protein [Legionella bononiensis]|uniref:Substrate of the Dot/Icm secretion system n=1 Tax=Legionella bononiensis TaxID=2793102 RepID=A0ABS1WBU5_9GAMM|nr:hypothetical protein [Legionella bononiensis]MBL7481080.1 hypothetical protein [Legionella bononiensis]MBL7526789.1 hypothetical protein [Legionella bononiensis]MBL7564196.1 hypothetical protein [Legionella bononiensis]